MPHLASAHLLQMVRLTAVQFSVAAAGPPNIKTADVCRLLLESMGLINTPCEERRPDVLSSHARTHTLVKVPPAAELELLVPVSVSGVMPGTSVMSVSPQVACTSSTRRT
jgi:hypothetical protein